ncbi:MAG: phospho-N-acetylmuramoyl-pentapeptide-transferase [Candidatus Dadabacteria bacterium]|nr:MAG: phospho-N-acetylmuramoyl-pentapeptide-transferase [Candidatus Dadabacteria bacterium]
MFYYFYDLFVNSLGFLNILQYITLRSALAGISSFFIIIFFTPKFINYMNKKNFSENISSYLTQHEGKKGTPNMGGIVIGFSILISSILYGNFENKNFLLVLGAYILFAFSGFIDDLIKLRKGKGLSISKKIFMQISITLFLILFFILKIEGFSYSDSFFSNTFISLPFTKELFDLGLFYYVLCFLIILGSANAVNLTDGLDGLATGSLLSTVGAIFLLTYIAGNSIYTNYLYLPYIKDVAEISILLSAILGSLLGFLWFNSNPAQIFMGDVGSIPLGATIGLVSIIIKQEVLLLISGGIFVIEALSVIIQIISFRLYNTRILKMAPLHHHFEKMGYSESKIVIRFWILSIILALITIASLKIR